ncbi:MAG TPA: hypothetical protein VGC54_02670 [Planctomycetota bacterium]
MKQKFAEALREYRKEVFRVEHDPDRLKELTETALHFSEDALDNAYHFHFHKLPDADRAEIINMINNYTLEALLPPVVEKIMRRLLLLENKLDLLGQLIEQALDRIGESDD